MTEILARTAVRDVYSVSRLNREARALLESHFSSIWLEGEISNLARPASGHLYFSLKDANSQVRCAMFRSRNMVLRFVPENGLKVLARAEVSLYEGRGEFQLIVERLEPAGDGALRLAFEQLKRRLEAEGLFRPEHKLTLPAWPRAIGVVTSPTGAAIRDILSVLRRRFAAIPVIIYPVPVQGAGAGAAIARALTDAAARAECDALILARGGGSLEDLWAFNEEVVARAIFACPLPIVSGVGHEIDFTIADLVADRRAATPSAAAELLSPDRAAVIHQLNALSQRVALRTRAQMQRCTERLGAVNRRLLHPGRRLRELMLRADDLCLRLERSTRRSIALRQIRRQHLEARLLQQSPLIRLAVLRGQLQAHGQRLALAVRTRYLERQARLDQLARALHSVSPLATLKRGYAIATRRPENVIVRSARELVRGDQLAVRLAEGCVTCEVQEIIDNAVEHPT